MKKQFLVLAVASAMLSLYLVPSSFGATTTNDPLVSAAVVGGDFTCVGTGELASGSTITLGQLTASNDDQDTKNTTTRTTSNISITDADTDIDGFHVEVDASDFKCSATTASCGSDIAPTYFSVCAEHTNATDSAATATTSKVGTDSLASKTQSTYTINDSQSGAGVAAGSFTFNTSFTQSPYCLHLSSTAATYFTSNESAINGGRLQNREQRLTVPGGSTSGVYKGTLTFTCLQP